MLGKCFISDFYWVFVFVKDVSIEEDVGYVG